MPTLKSTTRKPGGHVTSCPSSPFSSSLLLLHHHSPLHHHQQHHQRLMETAQHLPPPCPLPRPPPPSRLPVLLQALKQTLLMGSLLLFRWLLLRGLPLLLLLLSLRLHEQPPHLLPWPLRWLQQLEL